MLHGVKKVKNFFFSLQKSLVPSYYCITITSGHQYDSSELTALFALYSNISRIFCSTFHMRGLINDSSPGFPHPGSATVQYAYFLTPPVIFLKSFNIKVFFQFFLDHEHGLRHRQIHLINSLYSQNKYFFFKFQDYVMCTSRKN